MDITLEVVLSQFWKVYISNFAFFVNFKVFHQSIGCFFHSGLYNPLVLLCYVGQSFTVAMYCYRNGPTGHRSHLIWHLMRFYADHFFQPRYFQHVEFKCKLWYKFGRYVIVKHLYHMPLAAELGKKVKKWTDIRRDPGETWTDRVNLTHLYARICWWRHRATIGNMVSMPGWI